MFFCVLSCVWSIQWSWKVLYFQSMQSQGMCHNDKEMKIPIPIVHCILWILWPPAPTSSWYEDININIYQEAQRALTVGHLNKSCTDMKGHVLTVMHTKCGQNWPRTFREYFENMNFLFITLYMAMWTFTLKRVISHGSLSFLQIL